MSSLSEQLFEAGRLMRERQTQPLAPTLVDWGYEAQVLETRVKELERVVEKMRLVLGLIK